MVNTWVTWIADKVIARLAPLIRGERPGIGWLSSRANYRCVCIRTEKQFHRAELLFQTSVVLAFGRDLLEKNQLPYYWHYSTRQRSKVMMGTLACWLSIQSVAPLDDHTQRWRTKWSANEIPKKYLWCHQKVSSKCLHVCKQPRRPIGKGLYFCCKYRDPFFIFVIGHKLIEKVKSQQQVLLLALAILHFYDGSKRHRGHP